MTLLNGIVVFLLSIVIALVLECAVIIALDDAGTKVWQQTGGYAVGTQWDMTNVLYNYSVAAHAFPLLIIVVGLIYMIGQAVKTQRVDSMYRL